MTHNGPRNPRATLPDRFGNLPPGEDPFVPMPDERDLPDDLDEDEEDEDSDAN